MLETLEPRTVPAAVFTFTDVDGDLVKITASHGTNADLTAAAYVLNGQLQLLDLSAAVFQNADITASVVTRSAAGDGLVNIGHIDASGRDLGAVHISGDLGDIDCGDATTSTPALKSLNARSMGLFGRATQGGTGDLESVINGGLGKLIIQHDLVGTHLFVNAGGDGTIGSVFVGGSILGGNLADSGQIQTSGNMGPVKIGGDLVGGTKTLSGAILAGGNLANISIGGSVVGGLDAGSGFISSEGDIGPIKIGGDLVGGAEIFSGSIQGHQIASVTVGGSLLGGAGQRSASIFSVSDLGPVSVGKNVKGDADFSGRISAGESIASVRIGGSLIGDSLGSGAIVSGGALGPVKVGGDVKGGSGSDSGKIDAGGNLGALTIGGSLIGGGGDYGTVLTGTFYHSGQVFAAGSVGSMKIGGNLLGSAGGFSASISSIGAMGDLSIGGSVIGGSGDRSGSILTPNGAPMGNISIRHDLRGGQNNGTGSILATGTLKSVTIGGSFFGGTEQTAGVISVMSASPTVVKIGHDLVGGRGEGSGVITNAERVTIGGSIIGGTGETSGGISSSIVELKSVRIGHDLLGGSIPGQSRGLNSSGFIDSYGNIGDIFIGGSIISGTDGSAGPEGLNTNATIRAGGAIGSLTVGGDLVGNVSPNGDSLVIISAFGQETAAGATSDVAIGKITIGGRVEWAQIFAGYNRNLVPKNADAQIGRVWVGADWIASSIVAGVTNLGKDAAPGGIGLNADNVNFGDLADRRIDEAGELSEVSSRIDRITIGGQVFGSPKSFRVADQFGFVAEEIGALKVGARSFTLTAGAHNDGAPLSVNGDSSFHEIGSTIGSTFTATTSAKLVNATTVTYLDTDGDKVIVTLSKPLLTAGNVNKVFHFNTGMVDDGIPVAQQLRGLDLYVLKTNGVGVTFSVVRSHTGDGLVNVGTIDSTGYDAGTVTIPGDLGHIYAGDANFTTPGLAALKVRSLGRLGLDTQAPATMSYTPSLESYVFGRLGTLKVQQDVTGAAINVDGSIGQIGIGGSLTGADTADSGVIKANQNIGAIQIGHHLQGGFGQNSGGFLALGGIGSIRIGGSVLGAAGAGSGTIFGDINGFLQVAHNIRGGTNSNTGTIAVDGARIAIGGSLIGSDGEYGARIVSDGGIGAVKIGGNVIGGAERSATIEGGRIASVKIGGSLIGNSAQSGSITASSIGPVDIAQDVQGGSGNQSGRIAAETTLAGVTIRGSLLGGSGAQSGQITSGTDTVFVAIGGDVRGGLNTSSGMIQSGGQLNVLTVRGSLIGGAGINSGAISSAGDLGSATIDRNLFGGSSTASGYLFTDGDLTSLKIGGSLVSGLASGTGYVEVSGHAGRIDLGGDVIGGQQAASGSIYIGEKIVLLNIGGSLAGGRANTTGKISAEEIGSAKIGGNILGGSIAGANTVLKESGYIETAHDIGKLTVGGSLFAGWDSSTTGDLSKNASIRADGSIGSLEVKGSLHGHATPGGLSPVVISARGIPEPTGNTNVAIKSIRVGSGVERANIFGGYTSDLAPGAYGAQIGSINVGRDWMASNVVVGAANLGTDDRPGGTGANADNVNFGDGHDMPASLSIEILAPPSAQNSVVNRIASIVIGGIIGGTEATGDHFGFSTPKIGSLKSLNFKAPMSPTKDVIELSPTTSDVSIREQ